MHYKNISKRTYDRYHSKKSPSWQGIYNKVSDTPHLYFTRWKKDQETSLTYTVGYYTDSKIDSTLTGDLKCVDFFYMRAV